MHPKVSEISQKRLKSFCAEKTEEFVPLLKKCHDTPGVHVVELAVDYSENDRILNHEIKERSQKI